MAIAAGEIRKPVIALIVGQFQERYPKGLSFGHVAVMIRGEGDSASEKRHILRDAGVILAPSLDKIPALIRTTLAATTRQRR